MVQLKYFGDSRDYFKYDLIAHVIRRGPLLNYVFVPMLTEHRVDGEGNKLPNHIAGKSKELLSFIDDCNSKDLNHWETWLSPLVKSYKTLQPVNETFFGNNARSKYWRQFEKLIGEKSALVFVDPDTGLETGSQAYLEKMGREKYLSNGELRSLFQKIDEDSVLMIYQHLPRNKKMHEASASKKVAQAAYATRSENVVGYREEDLAFLFLAKSEQVFRALRSALEDYLHNSGHAHKSIHFPRSGPGI